MREREKERERKRGRGRERDTVGSACRVRQGGGYSIDREDTAARHAGGNYRRFRGGGGG